MENPQSLQIRMCVECVFCIHGYAGLKLVYNVQSYQHRIRILARNEFESKKKLYLKDIKWLGPSLEKLPAHIIGMLFLMTQNWTDEQKKELNINTTCVIKDASNLGKTWNAKRIDKICATIYKDKQLYEKIKRCKPKTTADFVAAFLSLMDAKDAIQDMDESSKEKKKTPKKDKTPRKESPEDTSEETLDDNHEDNHEDNHDEDNHKDSEDIHEESSIDKDEDAETKTPPKKKRKHGVNMYPMLEYQFKNAVSGSVYRSSELIDLITQGVYIIDVDTKEENHTDPIDFSRVMKYAQERYTMLQKYNKPI
jgi:hypothetical protein